MSLQKNRRRRRGAGMTEYIIVVGLVAIGLIPAVRKLSQALGNSYTTAAKKLDTGMGGGGGGAGGSGDAGPTLPAHGHLGDPDAGVAARHNLWSR